MIRADDRVSSGRDAPNDRVNDRWEEAETSVTGLNTASLLGQMASGPVESWLPVDLPVPRWLVFERRSEIQDGAATVPGRSKE